ncbi:MAG: SMP-30/gluconolactonase/LRE family protein [Marinobacterium sp.]|nr:SMP-30/gluconolactonase/LRE family protein [Marinobacterium sp.]
MFHVHDPAFHEAIDATATLEKIAGDFGFTEGPIWHPDEDWLLFSDIANSRQYKWREDEPLQLFRAPSNQANGNAFDTEGRVISCEHASSQLVRHQHDGKLVNPIATHYHGFELNSPNDVVVDSKGRIWFTDPSFGRLRPDLGIIRDQELAWQGVFRLDPDGTLTLVAKDFQQPNGLCFSNDEQTLFVNDTHAATIRAFSVHEDGSLHGGEVWATVTGEGPGVADGMKTDLQNRIYCNGPGGVHLFASDGQHLGVIRTPEKSTNFCFGGPDRSMLFITASTSVYRIQTRTSGARMIPAS